MYCMLRQGFINKGKMRIVKKNTVQSLVVVQKVSQKVKCFPDVCQMDTSNKVNISITFHSYLLTDFSLFFKAALYLFIFSLFCEITGGVKLMRHLQFFLCSLVSTLPLPPEFLFCSWGIELWIFWWLISSVFTQKEHVQHWYSFFFKHGPPRVW